VDEQITTAQVAEALCAKAEDYRRRLSDLRKALGDEGKDAVDPGHSTGAISIKFEIECIEQLLSLLPTRDSVERVVACTDPETGEKAFFAVVTKGSGGISLQVGETEVQTLSLNAPTAASLLDCRVGDDTPLGRIVALDCKQS